MKIPEVIVRKFVCVCEGGGEDEMLNLDLLRNTLRGRELASVVTDMKRGYRALFQVIC